ncbi:domain found in IF2B/IF5-domain-containing protein [Xylariomycetidae sp. FL2044]|nr:domain found in IF2B/IF5-domain-containing protein [Xylariomycetidae sp. FL2044]
MASTEENKDTALSHSARTPPLSAALGAFTDPKEAPVEDEPPVEEGGLDLTKKKKKKKKTEDADGEPAAEGADDGGLDLGMKKKKKKKAPKEGTEDEFAAKIAALNLEKGADGEAVADPTKADGGQEGDMDKGTGIWEHDETKPIVYDLLLSRFFSLLSQKNPDHAQSGSKSYKIPPPQCLREGNKKTILGNLQEICKRMKRGDEHVIAYLFAELGTNGSVDGSKRLVIRGRFQQKQIENVLRKYIIEYVACKTCRSGDTELSKGENRLYFITCNSCGSRRSVTAIKTGFSAQVGKRKKMQG